VALLTVECGGEEEKCQGHHVLEMRLPQPALLRVVKEAESSTLSPAFTVSATSDQKTFIRKDLVIGRIMAKADS
jgi:hypothetical protein